MKHLLLILFLTGSFVFAQKNHYLSAELAGSGGVASINYELQVYDSDVTDVFFRSGLSFAPVDVNNGTAIVFPLMVHGTFGPGAHKADVGLGQAFSITTRGSMYLRMPASFGYRFQPVDKRYYLRLSYTPIISYIYNFQWEHWGGFTFGFRLNK